LAPGYHLSFKGEDKMETELREYIQLEPGTLVILYAPDTSKEFFLRAGSMIEISERNLTFTYLGDGKNPSGSLLLMILRDREITPWLGNIPCTVIDDNAVYTNPDNCLQVRRCSVEFGELTESQRDKLEITIRRISAGAVPIHSSVR